MSNVQTVAEGASGLQSSSWPPWSTGFFDFVRDVSVDARHQILCFSNDTERSQTSWPQEFRRVYDRPTLDTDLYCTQLLGKKKVFFSDVPFYHKIRKPKQPKLERILNVDQGDEWLGQLAINLGVLSDMSGVGRSEGLQLPPGPQR